MAIKITIEDLMRQLQKEFEGYDPKTEIKFQVESEVKIELTEEIEKVGDRKFAIGRIVDEDNEFYFDYAMGTKEYPSDITSKLPLVLVK